MSTSSSHKLTSVAHLSAVERVGGPPSGHRLTSVAHLFDVATASNGVVRALGLCDLARVLRQDRKVTLTSIDEALGVCDLLTLRLTFSLRLLALLHRLDAALGTDLRKRVAADEVGSTVNAGVLVRVHAVLLVHATRERSVNRLREANVTTRNIGRSCNRLSAERRFDGFAVERRSLLNARSGRVLRLTYIRCSRRSDRIRPAEFTHERIGRRTVAS